MKLYSSSLGAPKDYIEILFANVDCLTNKFTELLILLKSMREAPDIIVLLETNPKYFTKMFCVSEFQIGGYQVITKGFANRSYRGIMLYYKEEHHISEVTLVTSFEEFLCIELALGNKLINLLAVYRSPHSSAVNNCLLISLLEEVILLRGDHVFLGDFNFPDINWSTHSCFGSDEKIENKFLSFLNERFLLQHVVEPTRKGVNQSLNLLDLIVTSSDNVMDIRCYSPLGNGDHSMLGFKMVGFRNEMRMEKKRFCYELGDYEGLCLALSGYFSSADGLPNESADSMWCFLRDSLNELTNQFVPKRRRHKMFRFKMSSELWGLIKLKHRLWRKIYKYGDNSMTEFRRIRESVKRLARRLKMDSQSRIATEYRTSPKLFWSYIKSVSSVKENVGVLNVNGVDIMDSKDKADAFAKFFSSVYVQEDLFDGDDTFHPIELASGMTELKIDNSMVDKKLKCLDTGKSAGPDGIHPRILSEIKLILTDYLTRIFNLSLATGVVPDDWRTSIVVPLHKKGCKSKVENYRPIALTSICCKILESIVKDHIMCHFMRYDIFSHRQFGFLPSRSTALQLLKFLDEVTLSVDSGLEVHTIYTDLEKAFDRIPHNRLLFKLTKYGVHSSLVEWIKNYLIGRTFRVRVKDDFSDSFSVLSGVPQGSVLGPLLFVIYINDLCGVCENMYLFADDAKLFRRISVVGDTQGLQSDIYRMQQWFKRWQMTVNPSKCCFLRFGNGHFAVDYQMQDSLGLTVVVPEVSSVTDLGIVLDSKLQFKDYILTRIKKANSLLGLVGRNFRYLPDVAFVTLYRSLIRSQLEYGVQIWSPHGRVLIDELEKVQKRFTRMVRSCKDLSYTERLQKLQLPSLMYRRRRADLILLYRMVSGQLKEFLCPGLTLCPDIRTRGHDYKLATRLAHKDCRKFYFSNRVVEDWNRLPQSVVDARSSSQFKLLLDEFYGFRRYVVW